VTYCKECLGKQRKINELEEEISQLKTKLRYQQRTAKEGFFGSSTPSSRIPIKPNSCTEHQHNQGGAKAGHKGYGRSSICNLDMTRRQFKQQAAKIKKVIIDITNRQAKHPAVQKIQDIFRQKADQLYHWANNRNVPADNNLAERELRPLVIARKISFGSQSVAGAATRETLMTVLHTLRKRVPDATDAFKSVLDKLAEQPGIDLANTFFNLNSS
jgi:hypothetical protein